MVWAYQNPVYASADQLHINCTITHPVYGQIPYTASQNDTEADGAALYAAIVANAATTPIGAYVPPPAPALTTLKAVACNKIDAAAEASRQKYITSGAGQAMVYQSKASEATQFLATYPTADAAAAANAASYPFLNAEVGITGATLFDVATTIANVATQWIGIAANIENLRLTAKANVNAATTANAVATATNVSFP